MVMHVFVKNYGCSANLADGEVLAGCLSKAGYAIVESASKADVLVYNTCAVKGPTENRIVDALKRAPKDKKVIVAGCLPLINFNRLQREVRFDGVVGPAAGNEIVAVVNHVMAGEKTVALEGALKAKPALTLPQLRANPVISVVPVSYGCLGSCAYCCVTSARGQLRSYAIEDIIARVQRDLATGAKEIWVTSQDTACYGRDIGTSLAELLKAITDVKGDFKIRVGMMTPNFAKDSLNTLVEAFRSNKVFKFVHLPVQSGDDAVLEGMNRLYTIQGFKKVVEAFRAAFPEITLATDVICGFPGETRPAFEKTLKLIRDVKPDVVNVSKFFARPGTVAAEMRDGVVEPVEIKLRSRKAAKIVKQVALEQNKHWVSWTGEVLVDERGKVFGSWIGRNFAYKPVLLENSTNLLGERLQVKIVKTFSTHLSGNRAVAKQVLVKKSTRKP